MGAAETRNAEIDLRELWRVIVNRRWTIILITLLFLLIVWAAVYLMTPTYRASLTLQIDREDIKVVKIEEVTPVESAGSGLDYYQTQYELLKSRNLAQRVIDQLDLSNKQPKKSLLSQIKGSLKEWLGIGKSEQRVETLSEAARKEAVLSAFLRNLTVDPVRNSRLVKLRYDLSLIHI